MDVTIGDEFSPVTHDGCGGVAFYLRTDVSLDAYIDPADFRLLNGRQPYDSEFIACGSCGRDQWYDEGVFQDLRTSPEFYRQDGVWRMRP
jgi:hypothetical protein